MCPPHAFDIDIPHHLILRYRAAKAPGGAQQGIRPRATGRDRPQRQVGQAPWRAWPTRPRRRQNTPLRKLLEAVAEIDAEAELPKYHSRTATDRLKTPIAPDPAGPAFGQRKVALYATCFVDYNTPDTAVAAARVLAKQGVEARLVYPECCGMPQLEAGDLKTVAGRAERVAAVFAPLIEDGYDVVALTASCGLMMKFEWPLLLPENHAVQHLSRATKDISEYVVGLQKALRPGAGPSARGRRQSPSTTPATPAPRTWAPSRPRCCA